jgi:hypothetical protein
MGLVDSILQGVEGPDADFGGADSPDHLASDLCSFESFLQISSHSAVHWHQYIYIYSSLLPLGRIAAVLE